MSARSASPSKSARQKRTRAVSPARPARPTASLSPSTRVSVRPQTPASQPPTPESSRLRSLTNAGGLSFSSLRSSPKTESTPPIRITSKVSGVVKTVHAPTTTTPRPTHRNRTPSGSSNVSVATSPPIANNVQPTFYPITTATPAANPYRYAPPRPSVTKLGSPFSTLRVDLNTPPLSPPISSVSFSSHSSAVSHGAGSPAAKDGTSSPEYSPAAFTRTSSINGHHRSSSESLDIDEEEDVHNAELKVKATAKSNRKVRMIPAPVSPLTRFADCRPGDYQPFVDGHQRVIREDKKQAS